MQLLIIIGLGALGAVLIMFSLLLNALERRRRDRYFAERCWQIGERDGFIPKTGEIGLGDGNFEWQDRHNGDLILRLWS